MSEERRQLVRFRIDRAREALEEARLMQAAGHGNTFVNRLYYACFYAVSAALLAKGLASAKHAGVRAMLHQHMVKPGLVTVEFGKFYDTLFDNRQKGDYADLVRFELTDVGGWLVQAEQFVETLAKIATELADGELPAG